MTKKTSIVLATLAVLAAGSAALWWSAQPSDLPAPRSPHPAPRTGVVTTAINSHQALASYSKTGDAIALPADPALADALSLDSRLDFPLRLKTVHALYGTVVTPEQAAFMRAYVADPAIPAGLNIRQVRALKNDVLNVLCAQPGEETAATAAMLRALHADPTQDAGLRDYALQHLATLAEREPDLGWSAHWAAAEGTDPALAATALIHLAGLDRAGALAATERERLRAAALRLAADTGAKDPARTTAIQLCGRLGLTEARPLANDLARDARAGIPLRIAAIATLGDLGGDADTRAYLAALATGPERRLRVPAQSALKRLFFN